jgi:hypothetical protein
MILISIKIIDKLYNYEVHPYDSVYNIKTLIHNDHKFNIDNIVLESNGKILLNSMPISEYSIIGSDIDLILKLNGGKFLGMNDEQQYMILKMVKKVFIILLVIIYLVVILGGFTPILTKWLKKELNKSLQNITKNIDIILEQKDKSKYLKAIIKVLNIFMKILIKLIFFIFSFAFMIFIYIFTSFVIYVVLFDITDNHCKSIKISSSVSKITTVTYMITYGILQLSPFTVLKMATEKFPECFDAIMIPLRMLFTKLEPMFGPKLLREYPYIPVLAFRNPFAVMGNFSSDFLDIIYTNGAKYDINVMQNNSKGYFKSDYTFHNKFVDKLIWKIWKFLTEYGGVHKMDVQTPVLDGNFAGIFAIIGLIIGLVINGLKELL